MKKKLVSLFVAAAMMLALPSVAFAEETYNSPEGDIAIGDSGVVLAVDGSYEGELTVEATEQQASNVPTEEDSSIKLLASFEITLEGAIDDGGVITLTFYIGEEWAGYTAYVYIQHDDDGEDTETKDAVVDDNGTVTITMDRLSIVTLGVDEDSAPTGSSATTDTSSTSPATGVNTLPVLCVTAAAVVGAGVCAVSLRKSFNK